MGHVLRGARPLSLSSAAATRGREFSGNRSFAQCSGEAPTEMAESCASEARQSFRSPPVRDPSRSLIQLVDTKSEGERRTTEARKPPAWENILGKKTALIVVVGLIEVEKISTFEAVFRVSPCNR